MNSELAGFNGRGFSVGAFDILCRAASFCAADFGARAFLIAGDDAEPLGTRRALAELRAHLCVAASVFAGDAQADSAFPVFTEVAFPQFCAVFRFHAVPRPRGHTDALGSRAFPGLDALVGLQAFEVLHTVAGVRADVADRAAVAAEGGIAAGGKK